jgi:hypothetical protein
MRDVLLLGKQRTFNDTLTQVERDQVPPAAWAGLIGEGYVEPLIDMKPPDGWDEELKHLHARMDQLQEAIGEVIGLLKADPQPEKRGRGRPPTVKKE